MYHAIVRRRVRRLFEGPLSEGRWRETLGDVAEDVHHTFPGNHALGGERDSRAAMERWFERLGRLFPGLQFEVLRVASRGWPWSTWVAVEWIDRTTPVEGEPYENEGAHWIHLRWGKATYIHAYLDTQRVADTCERLAAQGIEEAAAEPITG
jgi:ketosteroid isomerase-like protein